MPELTFLGSGTSTGVPMLNCNCDTCLSDNPKDNRLRSSIFITDDENNIIIDTTPEFRLQCLRENIHHVDSVFITHHHADHIAGLDDLRPLTFKSKKHIPVYCDPYTEQYIRKRFSYIFEPPKVKITLPLINLQALDEDATVTVGKMKISPLKLLHGPTDVYGYKIDNMAYCTDVSKIPDETIEKLHNLDILIIDAVRFRPHPTHFSVDEACEVISELNPKKAYITHINHDIMHERDSANLPEGVQLAYDGLKLKF
jgi:phosphoribosyl 1,2-cyclic phosphate phosphodiesterase